MENNNKTVTDRVIDGLRTAAGELEELRLQLALGKMEARDIYDQSRKQLSAFIHEATQKTEKLRTIAAEEKNELKAMFESLQVQLALGKAETEELLLKQSDKLIKTLNALEAALKKKSFGGRLRANLALELHKFRIKMEIIKLKADLRKTEIRKSLQL